MSTFDGKILEYTGISIDRFDGSNIRSAAYFLSHCHADHMVGLSEPDFAKHLHACNFSLYCSEISKAWLGTDGRYAEILDHVVALSDKEPHVIEVKPVDGEEYDVSVTPIPSGHCPGSVMFLLEGSNGTVLYTGDFRWSEDALTDDGKDPGRDGSGLAQFFKSGGIVKEVEAVYVDTTFCVPEAVTIPARETCLQAVCDLLQGHVPQRAADLTVDLRRVWLHYNPQLGAEYLFCALADHFGTKIHVTEEQFARYKDIPDIASRVTTNRESSTIHACKTQRSTSLAKIEARLPCWRDNEDLDVLVVSPTVMWFTTKPGALSRADLVVQPRPTEKPFLYKTCFSTHSSLTEVRHLLAFLRPRHIRPNVIPRGRSLAETRKQLKDLERSVVEEEKRDLNDFKPLGKQIKRPLLSTAHKPGKGFDFGDTQALTDEEDTQPETKHQKSNASETESDSSEQRKESTASPKWSPFKLSQGSVQTPEGEESSQKTLGSEDSQRTNASDEQSWAEAAEARNKASEELPDSQATTCSGASYVAGDMEEVDDVVDDSQAWARLPHPVEDSAMEENFDTKISGNPEEKDEGDVEVIDLEDEASQGSQSQGRPEGGRARGDKEQSGEDEREEYDENDEYYEDDDYDEDEYEEEYESPRPEREVTWETYKIGEGMRQDGGGAVPALPSAVPGPGRCVAVIDLVDSDDEEDQPVTGSSNVESLDSGKGTSSSCETTEPARCCVDGSEDAHSQDLFPEDSQASSSPDVIVGPSPRKEDPVSEC